MTALGAESASPDRLLAIYLNDHLAGSALGIELVRRLRSSNEGEPEFAGPLARVHSEIEEDRDILVRLMDHLGVTRGKLKPALAKVAERLGRLKLNGQLRGYSPLSRVVELEGLTIGITGRLQLWTALEQSFGATLEGFDFGHLARRAADQRDGVEELQLAAARRTFPVASAGSQEAR